MKHTQRYNRYPDLVSAMIGSEAFVLSGLSMLERGRMVLPESGEILLQKPRPTGEDDSPYTAKSEDLWGMSRRLAELGFEDFEYVNHGRHAIIFFATDTTDEKMKRHPNEHDRRCLRIHLTPSVSYQRPKCPDLFRAIDSHVVGEVVCEEIEILRVLKPNETDPKLLLALHASAVANGYIFNDLHGGNIAYRGGSDPRIGVLEAHAVSELSKLAPKSEESYLREVNRQRDAYDQVLKMWDTLPHLKDSAMHPRRTHFSLGDVVPTLSHIVVLLNGDFHPNQWAGAQQLHPRFNNRRDIVEKILLDLDVEYFMQNETSTILIPQPNRFPPDPEKLAKTTALVKELRQVLKVEDIHRPGWQGDIADGRQDRDGRNGRRRLD